MKPMGTSPPIDRETAKIKREIYAENCKKYEINVDRVATQKGGFFKSSDCCVCGTAYSDMKEAAFGPNGIYCGACLRKAAATKDDEEARALLMLTEAQQ